MALFCRVIQSSDLPEILDYENRKLVETMPDEQERTLHSWHVRWRPESLGHYVPLGWSFLARNPELTSAAEPEGALVGYFIAQPVLFFDGQTQSLWVEHLSYSSLQSRDELCELAYRLCREKHFQRVFFPNVTGVANSVAGFRPEPWQASVICVKTTRT
ncbi:MAG: hypothetical protein KF789_03705 [Bdellovibrionaceae bacterium]|nr:hypothetical protein [Pseudobdellovibrionaceae bacterium]